MKKPIIIFDIDYTLYSTQQFRDFFAEILLSEFNISKDQWQEAYNKHSATLKNRSDFRPNTFLKFLETELNIPHKKLKKYYYQDLIHKRAIFEDVSEVLEHLSKTHTLGIFSEGFKIYQKHKLIKGKIHHHFHPEYLFIHRRKLRPSAIKKLPDHSIVIDDKLEIVDAINSFPNKVEAIWLNRKSSEKHPTAKTIHTLKELFNLIEKLT